MIYTREIQYPLTATATVWSGRVKQETGHRNGNATVSKKHFRLEYRYNAWKAGIREKIAEMTLNGSGVRDTGRMLQINGNTVCAILKKTPKSNPYFLTVGEFNALSKLEAEIRFSAETNEFWSFAGRKSNQRWTWYVIECHSGIILAWHSGKRQDRNFLALWELLKPYPTQKYPTDAWETYSKYIPPHRHLIGKDRTWKIERKNFNFRTYLKWLNRKTVCFLKNEQIHDKVTGMYIERFYCKTGSYGNNKF
jgi:IS1 family transposase